MWRVQAAGADDAHGRAARKVQARAKPKDGRHREGLPLLQPARDEPLARDEQPASDEQPAKALPPNCVTGDGIVTEVGSVSGSGRREVDADGQLVFPGFVDIHTHYDGQVSWDPLLEPSIYHGVTTVVMGNCGVGFAPVRPDRHEGLIGLMEGVEDIPGTALAEGGAAFTV